VLGVLSLALAGGYALLVRDAFFVSGADRTTFTADGDSPDGADDGLAVDASVLTIDPVTNTFQLRLDIDPRGSYRLGRRTANRQLDLLVNAANGEQHRTYAAGRPIELVDVALDAAGDAVLYPFDRHEAPLQVQAVDGSGRPVPVSITLVSDLHDWSVRALRSSDAAPGETSIDIVATRSAAVVSLAVAIMALVAVLVLVTIAVVVRSVSDPRTPDFAIVASLVALLFAIPALRSSLPEAPPPGTVTDFVVFLWALVVVGVLMVVLSLVYIRRYGRT
jgi:Domain of unknown function (DUF4436)